LTDYSYANGALIDTPHTYFYSAFGGADFMAAWSRQRQDAFQALGPSAQAPSGVLNREMMSQWPLSTPALLDHVHASLTTETPVPADTREWLARLIKKYETTKRIHAAYREGFIAVDKMARDDLSLYVRLGEIFDAAYAELSSLPALNAMLKTIDTLCAYLPDLPPLLHSRMARLIENERTYVTVLAEAKKVSW